MNAVPAAALQALPQRPPCRLVSLLPGAPWQPAAAARTVWVRGLCSHAAQVRPGDLFFAICGRRTDGHALIDQALAAGAAALVLERPLPARGVPQAVVPAARLALAQAAQQFFGDPTARLCCVGITGTNGKTSCAALLQSVLLAAGLPTGRIGTLGTDFGALQLPPALTTPEPVALLAQLQQILAAGGRGVVLEASSQALAQHRLGGVQCDAALFLNLSPEHLDWHGDMASYAAAKAMLFDRLKPQGLAVLNLDDAAGSRLHAALQALRPAATVWGYSRQKERPAAAQVWLEQAALGRDGSVLQLQTPAGRRRLQTPLCGDFNVDNLLACATVGLALQLPWESIGAGLAAVRRIAGRLETVSGPRQPWVVVDFAHTPAAVAQVLAALRPLCRGNLFCLLGCGGDRDPSKRGPMGAAASHGADCVVVTSDNPRSEDPAQIAAAVVAGIEAAGGQRSATRRRGAFWVELDRWLAIDWALQRCGPDDTLLIAGKGHETRQLIGAQSLPFDDREVARQLLQAWRPPGRRRRP